MSYTILEYIQYIRIHTVYKNTYNISEYKGKKWLINDEYNI